MKQALAVILLAGFALEAGCSGGGGRYPDTDVMEVGGYELKGATGVQKSGGLLQAGTLEYSGSGNLTEAFRDYVAAMRDAGWTSATDDITSGRAVGTMRKDNRTCSLEFISAGNQVRAIIKVAQTK